MRTQPNYTNGLLVVVRASRWWLLVLWSNVWFHKIASGCTFTATTGASFLNATLQRCRQRCRDSVLGCARIAYNSVESTCAINVGSTACSGDWTLHTVDTSCVYGRGKTSGTCSLCTAGRASHAQVGDLSGTWNLANDDGTAAGVLQVTIGGTASYSNGIVGQFVLFHTRADPRYPGAFFLAQPAGAAAGNGAGWEYAWLEDTVDGLQLTIRRFCGLGPAACAQIISPEGSPSFLLTLTGTPSTGSSVQLPCPLLDANTGSVGSMDPCCTAVTAISTSTNTFYSCSISAGSQAWQDIQLVNGVWNGAATLTALQALQGAKLVTPTSPTLCAAPAAGHALSGAVVIVKRGVCPFAQKTYLAQQAGALAVLVVDDRTPTTITSLTQGNTFTTVPSIPTWMMPQTVGDAIFAAVQTSTQGTLTSLGQKSTASTSALQAMCCQSTCLNRVAAASSNAGVPNTIGTCAPVSCAGYVAAAAPAPTSLPLPHSGDACTSCSSGLASIVQGRASCAPCSTGHTASSGANQCQACPAGRAGTNGQCWACATGSVPNSLRSQCVSSSGTTPAPGNTPAPTPAPTPSPPSPNSVASPSPYTPSAAASSSNDDGFPWGVVIGITLGLLACCGCSFFCYRVYASNADAISERGGVASVLGSVLGAQSQPSSSSGKPASKNDEEAGDNDADKGDSAKKGSADNAGVRATAGKQDSGGGGGGKSFQIAGLKVNFS